MGKQSRRANRRDRPRRVRYATVGPELRVVIATSPRSDARGVSLEADVSLAKAALLYADKVELVSPGAAMVASMASLGHGSEADLLHLLGSLDRKTLAYLGGGSLPENWQEIVAAMRLMGDLPVEAQRVLLGEHATPEVLATFASTRDAFKGPMEQMRTVASELLEKSGASELVEPMDRGLIVLNSVGIDKGGSTDDMVAAYIEHLKGILRDPSIHAMFDESTSSLARSLVREGHVEPNQVTLVHAQQAAVGGGLVSRLPTFPDARMSDVLALRGDLAGPLGRYRRAVVGLADKLRSQAYDAQASVEIDDLWRTAVAPSLDELQDELREHSFVREFAKQVASTPAAVSAGVASAGVLFMGMQSVAGIESLVAAAGGAAPVVAAALHHGVQAAGARRQIKNTAERHDLFYLHELNRRL